MRVPYIDVSLGITFSEHHRTVVKILETPILLENGLLNFVNLFFPAKIVNTDKNSVPNFCILRRLIPPHQNQCRKCDQLVCIVYYIYFTRQ